MATLFLATFLNYFDRQTLGAAIPPIAREFGFDEEERGNLLAAFVFTYALSQPIIGFILDRIRNIRWFFPVMVCGWSASTMLVAAANDYTSILWLRRLLGFWEAVNFPVCIMIIARLFPANEHSLASVIFGSGAFAATLIAWPDRHDGQIVYNVKLRTNDVDGLQRDHYDAHALHWQSRFPADFAAPYVHLSSVCRASGAGSADSR